MGEKGEACNVNAHKATEARKARIKAEQKIKEAQSKNDGWKEMAKQLEKEKKEFDAKKNDWHMKPVFVKFADDPTKTAEENAADRQNMEKKGQD